MSVLKLLFVLIQALQNSSKPIIKLSKKPPWLW